MIEEREGGESSQFLVEEVELLELLCGEKIAEALAHGGDDFFGRNGAEGQRRLKFESKLLFYKMNEGVSRNEIFC